MKNKMFNVDDPANQSAPEEVKDAKVEDKEVKKEEIVKNAELLKGFTPEQVLKMKEDLRNEHLKELENVKAQERLKAIEDYKKEVEQQKEAAEKQAILDKIESDDIMKKQFEDFGVDYKAIDKDNLTTYMKIFENKKSENTAQPEGRIVHTKGGSLSRTQMDNVLANRSK